MSGPGEGSAGRAPQDPIARDLRDLRRGAAVTYLGYLIKTAFPVLLFLVVRAYGAEAFGLFAVAQAVLLLVARLCVLGLDKALLWWVPQRAAEEGRSGIAPVLRLSGLLSVAATVAIAAAAAPALARGWDEPGAELPLRLMALGLLPLVWSDVLVHAAMGRRRMEAQVVVKETVFPFTLVAAALGFHAAGLGESGLALAFLLSQLAAVSVAFVFHSRVFRGVARPRGEGLLPPPAMVRYAVPMWLSEVANALLLRMDVYLVTAFTDLRTVGVYAVVVQFANAVRAIRRSFDPIVLAIASEIGARHDPARLGAGYSYATFLVIASQLPVLVFLIAFAGHLMPLFGEGFDEGAGAVVILCAFFVVNGATSLSGIVVAAYGYAKLSFANVLATIAVQAAAQLVLVPRHGLEGAALAVGLAYTFQGLLQLVEMRALTGGFHYRRGVLLPFAIGAVAAAPMLLAEWLAPEAGLELRAAGFAVFLLVYGGAIYWKYRSGRLPGQETAAPAGARPRLS